MILRDGFEQGAHFARVGQATTGFVMQFQFVAGQVLRQLISAGFDTQPVQQIALPGHGGKRDVGGGGAEGLKINVCCEVGLARVGQRADRFVVLHRLECIAKRAPVAVIDDDRRSAVDRNSVRYDLHDRGG